MNSSPTRRDFLKFAVASAAVTPFLSLARPTPFERSGSPRFRLSLAAMSFMNYFPTNRGRPNPKANPAKALDIYSFVDYCAKQGFDGAELTSYFFPDNTDTTLVKLRRHCFLRGVPISGTAIGHNVAQPRGAKRDAEIAAVKEWVDRAVVLGAPHVRIFAGELATTPPYPDSQKLVIEALEECGDYAGKRGIFLGIENHDSLDHAATMVPLIKAVNSPWIGINLDPSLHSDDPYRDIAECAPYALNVQLQTEIYAGKGKKNPADFKRIAKLLRDGGYQGWIALKYESAEDPMVAVPRVLQEMRAAFTA